MSGEKKEGENHLADRSRLGKRLKMTNYGLPEDADIVRGFEKVEGGSGLLSMMVPEVQRLLCHFKGQIKHHISD